jgi:hypothetical protein
MPAKAATKKARRPSTRRTGAAKPRGFGRPGTAGKAEGDAAVRAWIAAVRPEQRPLVERLDALIAEVVPDVKRAVKWSMPFYGRKGQGWIVNVGAFRDYVSLRFFAGTDLDPRPPVGEGKTMRAVNSHDESEFDARQVRNWLRQAASAKGWGHV